MPSARRYVCVYTYTHTHTYVLHNVEMLVVQMKLKKKQDRVNAACQGNLPARRFGHAGLRLVSPVLDSDAMKYLKQGCWLLHQI